MTHSAFSPTDLRQLQRQLSAWRRQQSGRVRLPEAVWASATTLAQRLGAGVVARTLRLDYYKLRQRLFDRAAPTGRAPAFVEVQVTPPPGTSSGEATVELSDGTGARMTLRVGSELAAVVALVVFRSRSRRALKCLMTARVTGSARTCTLHNVRLSKSAKLLYPYHPLFGVELEVFGGAAGQRDVIYIRLPNDTTCGVPAWMFDEVICCRVRTAEQPTIDPGALWRLAELLDSVQANSRTGNDDASTRYQNQSSSTSPAIAAGSGAGTGGSTLAHPAEQSGQVRAVVPADVGDRRSWAEGQPRRRR